jgi:hypothetical protein
MGRKKAAPAPEATATQTNGKAVTLAGAVESALSTLGAEAETPAVRQWVSANYPTVDVNAPSFQSTLSVKRKKARGGVSSRGNGRKKGGRREGATRTAATRTTPVARTSTAPEPTLSDLLRAKEAADAQGGVEGLLKAVETVRAAAERVGGLENLSRSLEALRQLAGTK